MRRPNSPFHWIIAPVVFLLFYNAIQFALLEMKIINSPLQAHSMDSAILNMNTSAPKTSREWTGGYLETSPQYGPAPKLSRSDNRAQSLFSSGSLSRKPIPGEKTVGMFGKLMSGFRNEAMCFQGFVLYATRNNFTQILLPTIQWKDLKGTNRYVPHEFLFDVDHWNTFYPLLPRLVDYDPELYPDYDVESNQFVDKNAETNATRPFAFGRYTHLFVIYRKYTRQVREGIIPVDPVDVAMKKALLPHPDLMQLIERVSQSQRHPISNENETYLALHARVEPDMQVHKSCPEKKVVYLRDIFESLENHFRTPPSSRVFIAINRPLLESEAHREGSKNIVAIENLKSLNRARRYGLWNGTTDVFEAGMPSIRKTVFGKFPGICGAIVDYFLALKANIFVGTEVSSFSAEIIMNRFYIGNFENYHYSPLGLSLATLTGDKGPPPFLC